MNDLLAYKKNIHSQFGEDGIIERIFELVEPKNHWCVELGALNGVHHSNTRHLIADKEWSGVLIEPDETYFERLQNTYAGISRAHCINTFIDFSPTHSLDPVLARTPIPENFDLLSLDIDGNDYHIWESLKQFQPRVVIVEFNPTIPNDISFIQRRDMSVQQGSSLKALAELGDKKGYRLAAVSVVNAFFVRSELFPLMRLPERSLEEMNPSKEYLTRLYQLYDGTLVLDGYQRLLWRGILIDPEKIQVLPKSKRRYIAGISSSFFMRRLTYWYRRMPFYALVQQLRKRI